MGKHKNSAQEKIFISFMENHKDLARGFMKGDRVAADELWNELAKELNSHGPPRKDVTAWKKVWMDWKAGIRKKLSHNKSEDISTGGGPYNKFVISSSEDAVARVCGIYVVVEGVPDSVEFGVIDVENQNSIDFQTVSEDLQIENEVSVSATPRKRRCQPSANENINQYMVEQTNEITHIAGYMKETLAQSKNLLKQTKFIESNIRKVQKSIDSLRSTLEEQNKEIKRHNLEMEKCRMEEFSLKKRKLEIEEMRLSLLQ